MKSQLGNIRHNQLGCKNSIFTKRLIVKEWVNKGEPQGLTHELGSGPSKVGTSPPRTAQWKVRILELYSNIN